VVVSPGPEEGKSSAAGGGSITGARDLSSQGPWKDVRGEVVGGATVCVGEWGGT